MKCPKCSYLSFEAGDRCRNCGYDFSLLTPPTDDPAADLPLFEDDRPLVSVPAAPRAPLSVRRTGPRAPHSGTHDPAKLRSRHTPPPAPKAAAPADLDLQFDPEPGDGEFSTEARAASEAVSTPLVPAAPPAASAADTRAIAADPRAAAPALRRLLAAIVDIVILGAIDLAVVYFTMRIAGLSSSEFFVLPVAPLFAFLLLINGGYAVMFTAATGQTIGKMAAGIRVVGTAPADVIHDRVTFGRAVLRTGGYFASLLPIGLGFLPAFIGPKDHRALHDRLAETRVVRA